MARSKKFVKGSARVNNLRIGDRAKEALQQVQESREKRGIFQSMNQLSVEAAFLLRKVELGDRDEDRSPVRASAVA